MQSNLEQFKRRVSNLMRPGKQGGETLGSPTNSGNEEEKSAAVAAYEAALLTHLREQAKGLPLNNPHKEREILEAIDGAYYSDSNFDPSVYELTKLPVALDVNEIKAERDRRKNQLLVVSKKVSDLILHHHPSYSAELKKVTELQTSLSSALSTCQCARKMIDGAHANFTVAGLTILGTYRKRQRLVIVLDALKKLKALRETDHRLRELFEEENYVGAIMMCSECQRAASSFRQYRCISDLAEKLHDTLFVIEEQLNNALASTAVRIDLERYSRVIAAYEMIGKIKTAADLVVMHFSNAISNATDTVVGKYVAKDVLDETSDPVNADKTKNIPSDELVSFLRELLSIYWRIWQGYHAILLWHAERPVLTPSATDQEGHGDSDYVETKLEQGLSHVWLASVHQVNEITRKADLNALKINEFLIVIELLNRMSTIGHRHFKSESVEVEDTLREKGIEFIKHYHHHSLDELAMFLEMEAWEAVPVKRHFSYKDLPEYEFLTRMSSYDDRLDVGRGSESEESFRVPSWELMTEGTFAVNPFDVDSRISKQQVLNGIQDYQADSDDSDVPEELKQDYIDDVAAETGVQRRPLFKRHESYKPVESMQPILSNAALNLLRLWGRYLETAFSLPSIAFDVVVLLGQLFDFYFLTTQQYFGSDFFDFGVEYKSPKLQQALRRIEETFPHVGKEIPANRTASSSLAYADRLFGLGLRIVAVESLIFVGQQLEQLRSVLERIVPSSKIAFVHQFYSQTVNVAPDFRRSVYGAVASKALNYSHFLHLVTSVNWEISELMSQHSDYVDFLVQDLGNLRLRLSELARTVRISKEAYVVLWEFCIQIISKLLVEGYSCARRCTNEGRALMQLDFQQLLLIMEKISNLRPVPHREYVESYIKAYYLPEVSIEQWIMERKDYSPKQLIGLLNVATHVGKKTRQRLTQALLGQTDDN